MVKWFPTKTGKVPLNPHQKGETIRIPENSIKGKDLKFLDTACGTDNWGLAITLTGDGYKKILVAHFKTKSSKNNTWLALIQRV